MVLVLGSVCFFSLLRAFQHLLFTLCVLDVPIPSAFNIFCLLPIKRCVPKFDIHVAWGNIRVKDQLGKNELIPVGVVSNIEDMIFILGCSASNLITTFLGFSFVSPFQVLLVVGWDGGKFS